MVQNIQEKKTDKGFKNKNSHYPSGLEMKIWNYWTESNSWIYFQIVLNKNWKIYWSEQSFTNNNNFIAKQETLTGCANYNK